MNIFFLCCEVLLKKIIPTFLMIVVFFYSTYSSLFFMSSVLLYSPMRTILELQTTSLFHCAVHSEVLSLVPYWSCFMINSKNSKTALLLYFFSCSVFLLFLMHALFYCHVTTILYRSEMRCWYGLMTSH